jgi:hypothetical protein
MCGQVAGDMRTLEFLHSWASFELTFPVACTSVRPDSARVKLARILGPLWSDTGSSPDAGILACTSFAFSL